MARTSIHNSHLFQFIFFCIAFTGLILLMKSIYYNLQVTYPPELDPEVMELIIEDSEPEIIKLPDGNASRRFAEDDVEGYKYYIERFVNNVKSVPLVYDDLETDPVFSELQKKLQIGLLAIMDGNKKIESEQNKTAAY